MNQLLILQQLPLRRLKHILPAKQADPPAENHPFISGKLFNHVGIIEPHHPDIARLVSHDSLGAPPATEPDLTCLPNIGNDGLLFTLGQLRNRLRLAVIEVAAREEVKQVTNRAHTQPLEFGSQACTDTFYHGNG